MQKMKFWIDDLILSTLSYLYALKWHFEYNAISSLHKLKISSLVPGHRNGEYVKTCQDGRI